jgi:hypothetical protein
LLRSTTVASRTAAPLGSVTVPITVPVVNVCAFTGCEMVEEIINIPAKRRIVPIFFTDPPLFHFRKFEEIGRERSSGTPEHLLPKHSAIPEHSPGHSLRPTHPTNSTILRSPTLAGAFPPEGEKDSDHICQRSGIGQDNLSNRWGASFT